MTPRKADPQNLQLRFVRRKQMQQSLLAVAVLALLISGCSKQTHPQLPPRSSQPVSSRAANPDASTAAEADQAVFYKTTEQCEADMQQQQDEYNVLLKAYQAGSLAKEPTSPLLKPEDCAAQMQAAQQEYNRNAPTYSTLVDCQANGVVCESHRPANQTVTYYRPVFGGYYLYPFDRSEYVYINYGGSQRQVYRSRTVYQSSTGQAGANTSTRPSVSAPQRPTGTSGQGNITGRSSTGFGSTYKSTGRGGK